MDPKYTFIEVVQFETTAAIITSVLNDRYAALKFEAVENGVNGYDLKVCHMHQPEVKPQVIEKIKADIAMIRFTIHETV
jgi:hypothetical protein